MICGDALRVEGGSRAAHLRAGEEDEEDDHECQDDIIRRCPRRGNVILRGAAPRFIDPVTVVASCFWCSKGKMAPSRALDGHNMTTV